LKASYHQVTADGHVYWHLALTKLSSIHPTEFRREPPRWFPVCSESRFLLSEGTGRSRHRPPGFSARSASTVRASLGAGARDDKHHVEGLGSNTGSVGTIPGRHLL